jgi:hypothetical protein
MYKFTFVFYPTEDLDMDLLEDNLHNVGCDDALLYSEGHELYLEFDRKSTSLIDAVNEAIDAVESIEGLEVEEILHE